jgi:16S rRNA (guanine(966)-N(2))-methyltransferase RsmD
MRIIAGNNRGKKITQKVDETTRPTTDRVRENVFNVLCNIIDISSARVLDLFAGVGAYGLESHSRGAGEVVFNDIDNATTEVIKKNCHSIGCNGVVLNLDFRDALKKLRNRKFDIVFIDPPYEMGHSIIPEVLETIAEQKNLADNGIIVIETELSGLHFPDFRLIKFKFYGRVLLYFLGQHSPSLG